MHFPIDFRNFLFPILVNNAKFTRLKTVINLHFNQFSFINNYLSSAIKVCFCGQIENVMLDLKNNHIEN